MSVSKSRIFSDAIKERSIRDLQKVTDYCRNEHKSSRKKMPGV